MTIEKMILLAGMTVGGFTLQAMQEGHEDIQVLPGQAAVVVKNILRQNANSMNAAMLEYLDQQINIADIQSADTLVGATAESDGTVVQESCLSLAMKNNFPLDTIKKIWAKGESTRPGYLETACFVFTTPDKNKITYFVPVNYAAHVERMDVLSWLLEKDPFLIDIRQKTNITQDGTEIGSNENINSLTVEWPIEPYKAMVTAHLEATKKENVETKEEFERREAKKRTFFNQAVMNLINNPTKDFDLYTKKLAFLMESNPVDPLVTFKDGEGLQGLLENNNFIKSLVFANEEKKKQAYDNQIPQKQMHFLKGYLWQAYFHEGKNKNNGLDTILNDTNFEYKTPHAMVKELRLNWREYGTVANEELFNELETLLDPNKIEEAVEKFRHEIIQKNDLFNKIKFAPIAGKQWQQEVNKEERNLALLKAAQQTQSSQAMNVASEIRKLLGKSPATETSLGKRKRTDKEEEIE